MKHAGPAALDELEPLLESIRAIAGLVERKRGIWYRRSSAFLHFHEDPVGLFADLKIGGSFQRFRVSSATERRELLRQIRRALED